MLSTAYSCALDMISGITLQIHLVRNVKNVEEIRQNIVNGEWKCAAIKPSLILDPFQIVVAANKAAVSEINKSLVTRTVFAELLFNLSLSKNITKSLNLFGIESDEDILVCFLKSSEEDPSEDILLKIKGDICPISELCQLSDLKKIRQAYKINDVECKDEELLDFIVSKMVTKNFVTY